MIKYSIERLPEKIQTVVLKARAAEQMAKQSFTDALVAEQQAKDAMQRAGTGENGFKVSDWGDGYIYLGEWGKNTPHGYGVLDTKGKHGFYYGQWRHGYKQGFGVYIYNPDKQSLKYSGKFWRDLMHGVGIYEWKQGNKWSGEMKQDSIWGHGIFQWDDGRVFEGFKGTMKNWRQSDPKDRFGVEWQPKGDFIAGTWKSGVFIQ